MKSPLLLIPAACLALLTSCNNEGTTNNSAATKDTVAAAPRPAVAVTDVSTSPEFQGATLALGGSPSAHMDKGWYFDPTLFIDVRPEMRIAREEVFGPVVSVLRVRETRIGIRDVLRMGGDAPLGLLDGGLQILEVDQLLEVG